MERSESAENPPPPSSNSAGTCEENPDDSINSILGPVVERTISIDHFTFTKKPSTETLIAHAEIHQQARKLIKGKNLLPESTSEGTKPESIFSRSMRTLRDRNAERGETPSKAPTTSGQNLLTLNPIETMTEEEIIAARDALINRLDPKLVEFIQKRAKEKEAAQKSTAKQMPTLAQNVPQQINDNDNEHEDKNMVNSGIIEKDKLEWAQDIKDPDEGINGIGKEARFDFNGQIILGKLENSVALGLHHHGEEMERAGYSIAELCILGRSMFKEQRVFSFELLRKIFINCHSGIYDEVFNSQLFDVLLNIDFLFFIRKGIDFKDMATINAALGCMAAMLYPENEELSLDSTFLWEDSRPYPSLNLIDEEPDQDLNTMKDFLIPELDVLYFLIKRTDLLTRLSFLLNENSSFTELGLRSVFQILIRIGRHSPHELLAFPKMLNYIWKTFSLPASKPTFIPETDEDNLTKLCVHPEAWKTFRIIACSNSKNAQGIKQHLSLESVKYFLNLYVESQRLGFPGSSDLILVIKEAFKLWISFLQFRDGNQEYDDSLPLIFSILDMNFRNESEFHNFDMEYLSYLFGAFAYIFSIKNNMEEFDSSLILTTQILRKIVMKLTNGTSFSFNSDLALLTLSKGFDFLSESLKVREGKPQNLNIDQCNKSLLEALSYFLNSKFYENLAQRLTTCSILIMGKKTCERYPKSFVSTKASISCGVIPLLEPGSPFHFFRAISHFAHHINCTKLQEDLFIHPVRNYLDRLSQMKAYDMDNVIQFYFLRFELGCLLKMLSIPLYEKRGEVLMRLLPHMTSDRLPLAQEMFKNILQLIPHTNFPKFSHGKANYEKGIWNGMVLDLFKRHLFSEEKEFTLDSMNYGVWTRKVMTKTWFLDPLKNLLSLAKTPNFDVQAVNKDVFICLTFLYQLLSEFPLLETPRQFEDLYVGITHVYLLEEPEVFQDPLISEILKLLFKRMMIFGLGFTSSLFIKPFGDENSSLNDVKFGDHYKALQEAHTACSYGDDLFGAFLLLPCRPPEESRLKTLFWESPGNYSIRLKLENDLMPLAYLTIAEETDVKLAQFYSRVFKDYSTSMRKSELLEAFLLFHIQAHKL